MQGKKKPSRQCIGCRESKEKKELIRIVRTPEGEFVLTGQDVRTGEELTCVTTVNVWQRRGKPMR